MRSLAPSLSLLVLALTACTAPPPAPGLDDELEELLATVPGVEQASATFTDNADLDELDALVTMAGSSTLADLASLIGSTTSWLDGASGNTHLSIAVDAPIGELQIADTAFSLPVGTADGITIDMQTLAGMLEDPSFLVTADGLSVDATLPEAETLADGVDAADALQQQALALETVASASLEWTTGDGPASSLYASGAVPAELEAAIGELWLLDAYRDGEIDAVRIGAGAAPHLSVLALAAPADEDATAVARITEEFEAHEEAFGDASVSLWFGALDSTAPAFTTAS